MTDIFSTLKKGHYKVILADPPWKFLTYNGAGTPHRTPVDHYEVESLDDLKAMPVGDLAAKDCLLCMWVMGSHLDQAIELGRAWGFTYKTDGFIWVKVGKHDPNVRPITMGKWSRKQAEYCLFFSRGKPKPLPTHGSVRQVFELDDVDQVIYAARREHSRKPDEQYDRIHKLAAGPYCELFARVQWTGWDAWGKEINKFLSPDVLALLDGAPAEDIMGF